MADEDAEKTPERRYTAAQAGEYVERATGIEQDAEDRLSYDQLVAVAAEVGVSEDALRAGIAQAEAEQHQQRRMTTPARRFVADRCLEILCIRPVIRPTRKRVAR